MKFVPESYKRNNSKGIDKFTKYLNKRGLTVEDKTEEDYGVDITAYDKDGSPVNFEIEMKSGYPFTTQESFKFSTVSFLARKKKWNKGDGFWYVIICNETDYFIVCHSSDIFKERYKVIKRIQTVDRNGRDEMYHVPKEICEFKKL